MSKSRDATEPTTLREAESGLEDEGFIGQFAAVEDGEILCFTCHTRSPAMAIELDALIRVEGESDPADMAAVGAIHCPVCGTRGTLIMKYGSESSQEDADALRLLEDHRTTGSGGTSSIG